MNIDASYNTNLYLFNMFKEDSQDIGYPQNDIDRGSEYRVDKKQLGLIENMYF